MPTNGPTAKTYPTEEQYSNWKEHADEMGLSVSEWIASMVEAGRKKFDTSVRTDDELFEVREQRNDMRRERDRALERVEELENRLHNTERETLRRFVEENPGCTSADMTQKLIDSTDERVSDHTDAMQGMSIRRKDGKWYPMEDDE